MARTHFTRILTTEQVKECHKMLEDAAGKKLPIDLSSGTFEVKAPDGDMVFSGIKHSNGKSWLVRMHKEVFDERTAQDAESNDTQSTQ